MSNYPVPDQDEVEHTAKRDAREIDKILEQIALSEQAYPEESAAIHAGLDSLKKFQRQLIAEIGEVDL